MKDLIDRREAIDAVCKSECEGGFCGIPCPEVNALKALPSAQPERRKGRWRKVVCECGYDWAKDAPISSVPNFCPQCGADMRGG